jgi:DNA polymerase III alpha subunit (gram-positive type)
MDLIYQNYHKHTHDSNIMTPDSPVTIEDYAKRCVELGHKVLSSVEHGWQGQYYRVYETAKKYDLKFIFGTEA